MTKDTITPGSPTESTGSNSSITAPSAKSQNNECSSVAAGPTTNKSSSKLQQTSKKQKSQLGLTPPRPSLPSTQNKTIAIVVPSLLSPPPPRLNRTTATVVPSTPPPQHNKTTPWVSIGPRPIALRINTNAAGSGTHQQPPVGVNYPLPFSSSPYSRGSTGVVSYLNDFRLSATFGASNQAPSPVGATYTRQMDHQQQRTVDFLSKMEGASNQARHPVDATFSPSYKFGNYGAGQHERYHPYIRQMDHQQQRTVDFLSQMEARRSTPVQIRRVFPPNNATLAEWASTSTLTLGNGRRQPVDLNMKLRLV